SWRLANIIGATLEGQAKHAELFTPQSPQGAAHFTDKAAALLFVDAYDFVEQTEFITAFAVHGTKRYHVLRKSRAAISDPGAEKTRPNAAVGSYAQTKHQHLRHHE